MAQIGSALHRIRRPKRDPLSFAVNSTQKRQATLLLYFPFEAKLLRTPFRGRVLRQIYELAREKLGYHVDSVAVCAAPDPDDPDQVRLLLSVWADIDKYEWREADRAISQAMFELEATWTEDEKADYLKMIDYEILPLNV